MGTIDSGPTIDSAVYPCRDPITALDPPCPEGGEVRVERVIGSTEYRVTSFFKSAQDDANTPLLEPPAGIPTCVVCNADSDMWTCAQAANRVYEQAGTLTISDGTNSVDVDWCTQGSFAMGVYDMSECATDPGVATGITPDAFGRTLPDGAYIDYAQIAGTPFANDDVLLSASFAGAADGYPASDFDVYLPPDFTATPSESGPVAIPASGDIELKWTMPAATNLPAGTGILMTATFIDTPPMVEGKPPVLCLMGIANPGGAEQSYTIPAAFADANIPVDGVLLRGAVSHTMVEYNDGTVRDRRVDQWGNNCYSQPFARP
jgi:hypothetical protein